MIARLMRWRDDRIELIRLKQDEKESWDLYSELRIKRRDEVITEDEWEEAHHTHFAELSLVSAEIAKIETRRNIGRAHAWGVPVPPSPFVGEDNTEHWSYYQVHGQHYLSYRGLAYVRREILIEMDLRFKPVLPWVALVISVTSLVVAVLKP